MQNAELYLVVNRAIGRFPGFLFLPMPILCVLLGAFGASITLTLFLGLGMGAIIMMGMFISLTWMFVVGQDPHPICLFTAATAPLGARSLLCH